MSQFIISANYRDRDSDYRWLVRPAGSLPSAAKAFRCVIARNVRFAAVPEGGECVMQALADAAVGTDLPDGVDRIGQVLFFDATELQFFDGITDEIVTDRTCEELHLHADGSIFARLLPVPATAPQLQSV